MSWIFHSTMSVPERRCPASFYESEWHYCELENYQQKIVKCFETNLSGSGAPKKGPDFISEENCELQKADRKRVRV
jgi:hypothetical protein